MFNRMDASPSSPPQDVKQFKILAMLGPFNHIHKKFLSESFEKGEAKMFYHPLTCFYVRASIFLGNTELINQKWSPTDIKPSASPYHQLLMFMSSFELPLHFFALKSVYFKLSLHHRIADFPPIDIGSGSIELQCGETVFNVSSDDSLYTYNAVVADILRAHATSFSQPMDARYPSPMSPEIPFSGSIDFDPMRNDIKIPFIGDLSLISSHEGSFAALISRPLEHPGFQFQMPKIERPRFFKDDRTPPYEELSRVRSLIAHPYFSRLSPEDEEFLKKYEDMAIQSPSGYLKILSTYKGPDINFNIPKMPFLMALRRMTESEIVVKEEFAIMDQLHQLPIQTLLDNVDTLVQVAMESQSLAAHLCERAESSVELAVAIYWGFYLRRVPKLKEKLVVHNLWKKCFEGLIDRFKDEFKRGSNAMKTIREIVTKVKTLPGKDKKYEFVRSELGKIDSIFPFRLPLDPSFVVESISTDDIIIFGSSLQPVKLDLLNADGKKISVIFKVGDDMQQDALALYCIRFIQERFKRFNIDLHLTPYRVTPITNDFGLCEFVVGARALSKILSEHNGSIEGYLSEENRADALNSFIKSSAGYSVISYVLGVGDRHLDNLLLTKDGRFLHVDFGYMFGQEPKPWPVAVRVVEGMTRAMGDDGYKEFLRYCSLVYVAIRGWADELCSYLILMSKANLPHLPANKDLVERYILDRLSLDLCDSKAGKKMQDLVETSLRAFSPKINEWLHTKGQMFKS